jgi:hypothetical protein
MTNMMDGYPTEILPSTDLLLACNTLIRPHITTDFHVAHMLKEAYYINQPNEQNVHYDNGHNTIYSDDKDQTQYSDDHFEECNDNEDWSDYSEDGYFSNDDDTT